MNTEELVVAITDYVNTFNVPYDNFNAKMSTEHNTLQQTFTRLCLSWIEHVASDKYHTDVRNKQSQEVCKKLLSLFKDEMKRVGYSHDRIDFMSKPSNYLYNI